MLSNPNDIKIENVIRRLNRYQKDDLRCMVMRAQYNYDDLNCSKKLDKKSVICYNYFVRYFEFIKNLTLISKCGNAVEFLFITTG